MNTDLYIFTGFLGSGKTTVLLDSLSQMHSRKVGVVVNEWGNLGVDRALIQSSGVENVLELVGGQIFCACLSGSFLNTLNKLLALEVSVILVETSGLAKPSTLKELVEEAEKRSRGILKYRGMVCVIDAVRFLRLRSVVKALDEQVHYADRLILTKADLVDPETVQEIIRVLKDLKSNGEVTIRAGKPILSDHIFKNEEVTNKLPPPWDPQWGGWGEMGRPETLTLYPRGPVGQKKLVQFLQEIAPFTFRIKGFVRNQDSKCWIQINGVGEEVGILPIEEGSVQPEREGITFIWKGLAPTKESVLEKWRLYTGTEE